MRAAPARRRTIALIGARCGPRPISPAMPEVSGVSDQPSVANQPGVGIRYQRTADGRMPPNAGRATSGHRKSTASWRLAGSIKARSLRVGSARNQIGCVLPDCQVLRRARATQAAAATAAAAKSPHPRLRAAARRSDASRAHRAPTIIAAACIARTARTGGLGSER